MRPEVRFQKQNTRHPSILSTMNLSTHATGSIISHMRIIGYRLGREDILLIHVRTKAKAGVSL